MIPALVSQIAVAPIDRHLTFQHRHQEYQDIFVTSFRRHPQKEEVTPEYEVFLVGSIDTAFSIWDMVLQVLV